MRRASSGLAAAAAKAGSDACKSIVTIPGLIRPSSKAVTSLSFYVLIVPAQVCSVDCSPMQPNQAVSGGTDRCIKVLHPADTTCHPCPLLDGAHVLSWHALLCITRKQGMQPALIPRLTNP